MQAISEKRQAEGLMIIKSILSGLFPVLTVMAYAGGLPPFAALAWGSLVAAVLFFFVVTYRKEWQQNIKNSQVKYDIAISIFLIVVVVHGLSFLALDYTSAQNAALLGLLEVAAGFVILGLILKKEPVSFSHVSGAMLMLASAVLVLMGNHTSFNIGDAFILVAVAISPVGNMYAKRALYHVSAAYFMFVRSIVGAVAFFILSGLFEQPVPADVLIASVPYLLVSGLVYLGIMKAAMIFGYKVTSVTHTISFSSLKPISVFVFAWLLLGQLPTAVQVIALVPSLLGLYMLTTATQKQVDYSQSK